MVDRLIVSIILVHCWLPYRHRHATFSHNFPGNRGGIIFDLKEAERSQEGHYIGLIRSGEESGRHTTEQTQCDENCSTLKYPGWYPTLITNSSSQTHSICALNCNYPLRRLISRYMRGRGGWPRWSRRNVLHHRLGSSTLYWLSLFVTVSAQNP